jgi:hypothetical protein
VPAKRGRKHLVIPDTQVKPGVLTDHIGWIAQYAVDKKPDVIVIIGDWADMPSLSSYDKGKKSFEGRTYKADVAAANDALDLLMGPIKAEVERCEVGHRRRWNPRLVVTLGNHEDRINRMIDLHRELDGTYSTDDIKFREHGFEVYPFLQPVVIDGVAYCHYFVSGPKSLPIGSAKALLANGHMSCVVGHRQGKDIAWSKRFDGVRLAAIQVGSCYLHKEKYLGPQAGDHWNGVMVLHEVNNGSFDEMSVSLDFLKERYAKA